MHIASGVLEAVGFGDQSTEGTLGSSVAPHSAAPVLPAARLIHWCCGVVPLACVGTAGYTCSVGESDWRTNPEILIMLIC